MGSPEQGSVKSKIKDQILKIGGKCYMTVGTKI